jgi:hypothetical protein
MKRFNGRGASYKFWEPLLWAISQARRDTEVAALPDTDIVAFMQISIGLCRNMHGS